MSPEPRRCRPCFIFMDKYSLKFFDWIREHANDDVSKLRLKFAGKKECDGINYGFAILQIECRKKCSRKLHETLNNFPKFIFPTALSAEQCTSDLLARYHSTLVPIDAHKGIDFTAGLGIDAFHFSARGLAMTAVEKEPEIAEALEYNSQGLGLSDFSVINDDCENVIAGMIEDGRHFDVGFIDPARRGDEGQRLYAMRDCRPDVIGLLPGLSKICDTLIIKASPMLDITQTIRELDSRFLQKIVCVGTSVECKELIAMMDFRQECEMPIVECVTLFPDEAMNDFSFTMRDESEAESVNPGNGVKVGMYLYDAFPAVMKSGAHKVLAQRFDLNGFGANTRLYYSEEVKPKFPGSVFKVVEVMDYASKNIKSFAGKYPSISISCRNFGVKADVLKKKLRVRDGDGSLRLFAIKTDPNRQFMLVAKKDE